MAVALKCDFCGRRFDYYNTRSSEKNYNSIKFCNVDENRQAFQHEIRDICPLCKIRLDGFLKNLRGENND